MQAGMGSNSRCMLGKCHRWSSTPRAIERACAGRTGSACKPTVAAAAGCFAVPGKACGGSPHVCRLCRAHPCGKQSHEAAVPAHSRPVKPSCLPYAILPGTWPHTTWSTNQRRTTTGQWRTGSNHLESFFHSRTSIAGVHYCNMDARLGRLVRCLRSARTDASMPIHTSPCVCGDACWITATYTAIEI